MKILVTREELLVLVKDSDIEVEIVDASTVKATATKALTILQPEPKPAPKKTEPKGRKLIDHGKIVACYKGGRSVSWIADEMKIAPQTVINHLSKEGIYSPKSAGGGASV